jgi:hypothetical protein
MTSGTYITAPNDLDARHADSGLVFIVVGFSLALVPPFLSIPPSSSLKWQCLLHVIEYGEHVTRF